MKLLLMLALVASLAFTIASEARGAFKLTPHRVQLRNGRSFELNLPEDFALSVAAEGLRRVRFMTKSPDGRIFVTDMFSLADNRRGAVYILDGFDQANRRFRRVITYLKNLRNPNSVAFYRDRDGIDWLYLALTDRLVRYRYSAGENAPTSQPEVLATFPDYGLSYKYGGWHLTRTVLAGHDKIYVSVGSSCNACEEREEVRATVLEMDPDGRNQRYFARGLRNAVGLGWIKDRLFATNMGADHLGDQKPADTMYILNEGANYGWPYCYQTGSRSFADPKFNAGERRLNCRRVPLAFEAFEAHSSPLGFAYFDAGNGPELSDSILVALHGSTKKSLRHGYRVVRLRASGGRSTAPPEDFINGFLQAGVIHGRPADILSFDTDAFLLTDDYAGLVYYIYKR